MIAQQIGKNRWFSKTKIQYKSPAPNAACKKQKKGQFFVSGSKAIDVERKRKSQRLQWSLPVP